MFICSCQCGFFVVEQAPGQIGEAAPIPFKSESIQVRKIDITYTCIFLLAYFKSFSSQNTNGL